MASWKVDELPLAFGQIAGHPRLDRVAGVASTGRLAVWQGATRAAGSAAAAAAPAAAAATLPGVPRALTWITHPDGTDTPLLAPPAAAEAPVAGRSATRRPPAAALPAWAAAGTAAPHVCFHPRQPWLIASGPTGAIYTWTEPASAAASAAASATATARSSTDTLAGVDAGATTTSPARHVHGGSPHQQALSLLALDASGSHVLTADPSGYMGFWRWDRLGQLTLLHDKQLEPERGIPLRALSVPHAGRSAFMILAALDPPGALASAAAASSGPQGAGNPAAERPACLSKDWQLYRFAENGEIMPVFSYVCPDPAKVVMTASAAAAAALSGPRLLELGLDRLAVFGEDMTYWQLHPSPQGYTCKRQIRFSAISMKRATAPLTVAAINHGALLLGTADQGFYVWHLQSEDCIDLGAQLEAAHHTAAAAAAARGAGDAPGPAATTTTTIQHMLCDGPNGLLVGVTDGDHPDLIFWRQVTAASTAPPAAAAAAAPTRSWTIHARRPLALAAPVDALHWAQANQTIRLRTRRSVVTVTEAHAVAAVQGGVMALVTPTAIELRSDAMLLGTLASAGSPTVLRLSDQRLVAVEGNRVEVWKFSQSLARHAQTGSPLHLASPAPVHTFRLPHASAAVLVQLTLGDALVLAYGSTVEVRDLKGDMLGSWAVGHDDAITHLAVSHADGADAGLDGADGGRHPAHGGGAVAPWIAVVVGRQVVTFHGLSGDPKRMLAFDELGLTTVQSIAINAHGPLLAILGEPMPLSDKTKAASMAAPLAPSAAATPGGAAADASTVARAGPDLHADLKATRIVLHSLMTNQTQVARLAQPDGPSSSASTAAAASSAASPRSPSASPASAAASSLSPWAVAALRSADLIQWDSRVDELLVIGYTASAAASAAAAAAAHGPADGDAAHAAAHADALHDDAHRRFLQVCVESDLSLLVVQQFAAPHPSAAYQGSRSPFHWFLSVNGALAPGGSGGGGSMAATSAAPSRGEPALAAPTGVPGESNAGFCFTQLVSPHFDEITVDETERIAMINRFTKAIARRDVTQAMQLTQVLNAPGVWRGVAKLAIEHGQDAMGLFCLGRMGDTAALHVIAQAPRAATPVLLALYLDVSDADLDRLCRERGLEPFHARLLEARGRWEAAIAATARHDRLRAKHLFYRFARHLVQADDVAGAIAAYETADAYDRELPQMLAQRGDLDRYLGATAGGATGATASTDAAGTTPAKPAAAAAAVVRMGTWRARQLEAEGSPGEALKQYQALHDVVGTVRLLLARGEEAEARRVARAAALAAAPTAAHAGMMAAVPAAAADLGGMAADGADGGLLLGPLGGSGLPSSFGGSVVASSAASALPISGHRAALFLVARHAESRGDVSEALALYNEAGCFRASVRLAQRLGRDHDLYQTALSVPTPFHAQLGFASGGSGGSGMAASSLSSSSPAALGSNGGGGGGSSSSSSSSQPVTNMTDPDLLHHVALYFRERGQLDHAARLYFRAGQIRRAVLLQIQGGNVNLLEDMLGYLPVGQGAGGPGEGGGNGLDEGLTQAIVAFYTQQSAFPQLVSLLLRSGRIDDALRMALQHHVTLAEDWVEHVVIENTPQGRERARQLAVACLRQRLWTAASKKFTQAGDRLEALKALLKSGDIEKIIFFTQVSGAAQKELFVVAANFLQQSCNWREQPELLRVILTFYKKAKAISSLVAFYRSCAHHEIEEYQDYDKALAAFKEAQSALTAFKEAHASLASADDHAALQAELDDAIHYVEGYLQAKACAQQGQSAHLEQICHVLLDAAQRADAARAGDARGDADPSLAKPFAVRIGDIYGLLLQHHVAAGELDRARSIFAQMAQAIPPARWTWYVPQPLLRTLTAEMPGAAQALADHAGEDDGDTFTEEPFA
ncbi:hypothetical protein CXG81DRAFT_28746 [Caulochytrium protostelioides]|uniref:Uncharacterized protein n=1 Tax=Caulochytrium protostelioides TaxID=1555241 RepID=A0A4P9WY48_9FUNG|nr:hypothetical protein CXG81DRAFT_28746 [Caulochytrium protostelioides]|eukprot:RKO98419.1 hypothetical protein CXG81DRAFT_28746 [Caulochytrium protostelioides]